MLSPAAAARGTATPRSCLRLRMPARCRVFPRVAASRRPSRRSFRGHLSHRFPQFLPDGRHFLFFVQGAATDRESISDRSMEESPGVWWRLIPPECGRRRASYFLSGRAHWWRRPLMPKKESSLESRSRWPIQWLLTRLSILADSRFRQRGGSLTERADRNAGSSRGLTGTESAWARPVSRMKTPPSFPNFHLMAAGWPSGARCRAISTSG